MREALVALLDQFPFEFPHYWISYGGVDPRVTGGRFRPAQPGPPPIPARGQDWTPVRRAGGASPSDLSLTALLAQALVGFAIEYEERAGALSDAVHTLRLLDPMGTPFDQAPARAQLSGDGKSRLERHGIVVVETRGGAGRYARLTPQGQWLRDAYEPTTAQVEARWRTEYGDVVVSGLRSGLEEVLPKLEAGLADHPFLVWSRQEGIRETSG